MLSGLLRVFFLIILAGLGTPSWAEENVGASGAVASWPTTPGKPSKIVLSYYYQSIWEAIGDLFNDSKDIDIVIHEYIKQLRPLGKTSVEVETSGNSISFRVPRATVSQSLSTGSGNKMHLPVRLYFDGQSVAAYDPAKDTLENGMFSARVKSMDRQTVAQQRGFIDIGFPRSATLYNLIRSFEGTRGGTVVRDAGTKIEYAGRTHCGYHAFKWEFQKLNKLVLRDLEPPMSDGNVFAKFDEHGELSSMVACNLNGGNSACRSTGFLNDWASFEVVYSGAHLCATDRLLNSTAAWLKSRITAEATASRAHDGELED